MNKTYLSEAINSYEDDIVMLINLIGFRKSHSYEVEFPDGSICENIEKSSNYESCAKVFKEYDKKLSDLEVSWCVRDAVLWLLSLRSPFSGVDIEELDGDCDKPFALGISGTEMQSRHHEDVCFKQIACDPFWKMCVDVTRNLGQDYWQDLLIVISNFSQELQDSKRLMVIDFDVDHEGNLPFDTDEQTS